MKSSLTSTIIKKTICFIAFAMFLLPFVIMIIGSFKPALALNLIPLDLSPFRNLTFDNYERLASSVNMARAFRNSLYIVTFVVSIEVALGITTGYVFAKKDFPCKRILFVLVIITMMLPRQLLLIPNFMVAKTLGLMDSLTGVALTTINASYGIFLTRQRVLTIPNDYYEAAKLDGCNDFQVFGHIIFPQLKPTMAAIAIYSMFGVWNDYLWQYIMLTSPKNQTIPVLLAYVANGNTSGVPATGMQLAGSVVALIPVLTFFFVFQKWFIEGTGDGAMKE